MIFYDSQKRWTLLKLRGSVIPRAMLNALPSMFLTLVLRHLSNENMINLNQFATLGNNNGVYSGFTFVLGFSLVFRTSQSYHRYWLAATSVHEMGSEWSDACASLIAFSKASKQPEREVQVFVHTIVRLFSLLHAMALEEIATLRDENFPLIDVQGFDKKDLHLLFGSLQQGRKMTVILNWIKVYMIRNFNSGILAVPAPILTRVYQELGAGLVRCYNAQQIVIWPFPFPYTQMNVWLIHIYMLVTPLVIATWNETPLSVCLAFTMVSMMCMLGLDLIASELENPFGDDANDLPTLELQHEMNRNLMCFLQPQCWDVPELTGKALFRFEELVAQNNKDRTSLEQYQAAQQSLGHRIKQGKGINFTRTKDVMSKQMRWAQQVVSDHHTEGMTKWLRASIRHDSVPHHNANASTSAGADASTNSDDALEDGRPSTLAPTALTVNANGKQSSYHISPDDANVPSGKGRAIEGGESGTSLPATQAIAAVSSPSVPQVSQTTNSKDPPWREFLTDLDKSLKSYLDNQMQRMDEQLKNLGFLQTQQVTVMERVLATTEAGCWESSAQKRLPSQLPPPQSSALRCCAARVEQKEVLR